MMKQIFSKKNLTIAAILAVLALGLFLRIYSPELDPPTNLGAGSQSIATDGYHVTSFAFNKAQFDRWELYDYPRWQVFKVSLASVVAWLVFEIYQPNIAATTIAGVVVSYGGILLFMWGMYLAVRERSPLAALSVAIFLAFNFILISYNRVPLLESGLIFYLGLIFFLWVRFGVSRFNLVAIGVLCAASILTGKVFGLALVAALFLTLLFEPAEKRFRLAGVFGLSFLVGGSLLLFILYGGRLDALWSYFTEHSTGSHGSLIALEGMFQFFITLHTFGSLSKMYQDSPALFVASWVAITASMYYLRYSGQNNRNRRVLNFCLFWLLCTFLMIAPFNYRPLRYCLLLYFPLVALICISTIHPTSTVSDMRPKTKIIYAIILFFTQLYFISHLITDIIWPAGYPQYALAIYSISTIPAGLLAWFLAFKNLNNLLRKLAPRLVSVFIVLAVGSAAFQGVQYYRWINSSTNSIAETAADLRAIIGDDALVTGPYGPLVTRSSQIPAFVYYFGLDRTEQSIFDRFPITHVALDESNLTRAKENFPQLAGMVGTARYLVRNHTVDIYFLPNSLHFSKWSDYEKAEYFLVKDYADSAEVYNRRFLENNPDHISGYKQMFYIQSELGGKKQMLTALDRLFFGHPNSGTAQLFAALYYKALGLEYNQPRLVDLSRKALANCRRISPDVADDIEQAYNKFN